MNRFMNYLYRPVSPSSLGLFRILFGLVMFIQTAYFIQSGFVEKNILDPIIHFKYHFFQFLEPLPDFGMHLLMWVMLLSTVLIMTGFFYRAGVLVFLLTFTYLWLLDKGYFNNHYYLISLMSFLMLWVQADGWGALGKKAVKSIPNWQIFILKAQMVIVFFIAGLNKINPYWLMEFQPMQFILERKAEVSELPFIKSAAIAAFFSYGGFLLDLLVGFGLWWKRTRFISILALIAFNVLNFWMFWNIGEIGIFPLMILSTILLFVEPELPEQWKKRFFPKEKTVHSKKQKKGKSAKKKEGKTKPVFAQKTVDDLKELTPTLGGKQKWLAIGLGVYLLFHLIFPFRHFLYPGHVDWTGEGQRFAWRMKIMAKEAAINFFIKNGETGEKYPVNVAKMLSPKQYTNLVYYPDVIPQLAQRLKKEAIAKGIPKPEVVADFDVEFMESHPMQALVDSELDLSSVSIRAFRHSDWILPLKK